MLLKPSSFGLEYPFVHFFAPIAPPESCAYIRYHLRYSQGVGAGVTGESVGSSVIGAYVMISIVVGENVGNIVMG